MIDWLLILAAVLSFVFGWNNSSFLIGNMRGSGTLTLRASIVISAVGLLAGALIEGPKMLKSLDGSLASSTPVLGLMITFAVSIVLTVALTVLALPVSFSPTMVGAFLGVALAWRLKVNPEQALLVVSFWFIATLLAGLVAFVLHRLASRFVSRFSLVASDAFNRVGVVASSLVVSYTLGANNVGLISGTALAGTPTENGSLFTLGLTLVAVAGTVLLGKGNVSDTIGDRMLSLSPQGVISVFVSSAVMVWVGTQLQVPMSISQCVLGGMLGAAYSQRTAVINKRLASESISTWIVIPVAAFLMAFLVSLL